MIVGGAVVKFPSFMKREAPTVFHLTPTPFGASKMLALKVTMAHLLFELVTVLL